MSSSTHATTEKRKVARIVFDRPPLKKLQFWLWVAAGAVVGLLLAFLLHWLYFDVADVGTDVSNLWREDEFFEWSFVLTLVGVVFGVLMGWGRKREVRARIEMVEQPTMQRRRSTSTALVRVDYGRRW